MLKNLNQKLRKFKTKTLSLLLVFSVLFSFGVNTSFLSTYNVVYASDAGSNTNTTTDNVYNDSTDYSDSTDGSPDATDNNEDQSEPEVARQESGTDMSFYDMGAAASVYFNEAVSPKGKGLSESWISVIEPSGSTEDGAARTSFAKASSLLGFPDSSIVTGKSGWFFSPDSFGTTTVSYKYLNDLRADSSSDDGSVNALAAYGYFGATLSSLGLDQTADSDITRNPARKTFGLLIQYIYKLIIWVDNIFTMVLKTLQTLNPFRFFMPGFTATSGTGSTFYDDSATTGKYGAYVDRGDLQHTKTLEQMLEVKDIDPLKNLTAFLSRVYVKLYNASWEITVPIFMATTLFSIVFFNRQKYMPKVKKTIFRVGFIVLGVPILGSLYTLTLNSMLDAKSQESLPATQFVMSTFLDYESWALEQNFAFPTDITISGKPEDGGLAYNIKEGRAALVEAQNVRNYAYALNRLSYPSLPNRSLNFSIKDGSSVANISSGVLSGTGVETLRGDDAREMTSVVESMLERYTNGATINGSSYENKYKGLITTINGFARASNTGSDAAPAEESENELISKWSGHVDEAIDKNKYSEITDNPFVMPSEHAGKGVNFHAAHGIIRFNPGGAYKDETDNADSKIQIFTPVGAFNYLNTSFKANEMTIYSSKKSSSRKSRQDHFSVNAVGENKMLRVSYLSTMIVTFVCFMIITFIYAFGMLFQNIVVSFKLISSVPFALLGSYRSSLKIVSYTVQMILQIFTSVLSYFFWEQMFLVIPPIIEQGIHDTVANITSGQNVEASALVMFSGQVDGVFSTLATTSTLVTMLAGSVFMIWFTRLAVKNRDGFSQGMNAFFEEVVDKMSGSENVNTSPIRGRNFDSASSGSSKVSPNLPSSGGSSNALSNPNMNIASFTNIDQDNEQNFDSNLEKGGDVINDNYDFIDGNIQSLAESNGRDIMNSSSLSSNSSKGLSNLGGPGSTSINAFGSDGSNGTINAGSVIVNSSGGVLNGGSSNSSSSSSATGIAGNSQSLAVDNSKPTDFVDNYSFGGNGVSNGERQILEKMNSSSSAYVGVGANGLNGKSSSSASNAAAFGGLGGNAISIAHGGVGANGLNGSSSSSVLYADTSRPNSTGNVLNQNGSSVYNNKSMENASKARAESENKLRRENEDRLRRENKANFAAASFNSSTNRSKSDSLSTVGGLNNNNINNASLNMASINSSSNVNNEGVSRAVNSAVSSAINSATASAIGAANNSNTTVRSIGGTSNPNVVVNNSLPNQDRVINTRVVNKVNTDTDKMASAISSKLKKDLGLDRDEDINLNNAGKSSEKEQVEVAGLSSINNPTNIDNNNVSVISNRNDNDTTNANSNVSNVSASSSAIGRGIVNSPISRSSNVSGGANFQRPAAISASAVNLGVGVGRVGVNSALNNGVQKVEVVSSRGGSFSNNRNTMTVDQRESQMHSGMRTSNMGLAGASVTSSDTALGSSFNMGLRSQSVSRPVNNVSGLASDNFRPVDNTNRGIWDKGSLAENREDSHVSRFARGQGIEDGKDLSSSSQYSVKDMKELSSDNSVSTEQFAKDLMDRFSSGGVRDDESDVNVLSSFSDDERSDVLDDFNPLSNDNEKEEDAKESIEGEKDEAYAISGRNSINDELLNKEMSERMDDIVKNQEAILLENKQIEEEAPGYMIDRGPDGDR